MSWRTGSAATSPRKCALSTTPSGLLRRCQLKNAHERFGWLEFHKRLKDTTTRVRLPLDRFIGEITEDKSSRQTGHLISVLGSAADVGAIWAAIVSQEPVTVCGPELPARTVILGKD